MGEYPEEKENHYLNSNFLNTIFGHLVTDFCLWSGTSFSAVVIKP